MAICQSDIDKFSSLNIVDIAIAEYLNENKK